MIKIKCNNYEVFCLDLSWALYIKWMTAVTFNSYQLLFGRIQLQQIVKFSQG